MKSYMHFFVGLCIRTFFSEKKELFHLNNEVRIQKSLKFIYLPQLHWNENLNFLTYFLSSQKASQMQVHNLVNSSHLWSHWQVWCQLRQYQSDPFLAKEFCFFRNTTNSHFQFLTVIRIFSCTSSQHKETSKLQKFLLYLRSIVLICIS